MHIYFEITFHIFIKFVFLKLKCALYFGKSNLNVKAGENTIKYPYTTIMYITVQFSCVGLFRFLSNCINT